MLAVWIAAALTSRPPTIVSMSGLVIAFRRNGAWIGAENQLKPQPFREKLSRVGIGTVQRGSYGAVRLIEGEGVGGLWIDGSDKLLKGVLTNSPTSVPRPVRKLSTENPAYLEVVRKTLAAKGVKSAKARINQIFQADFDGDRKLDILIEASNMDGEYWPSSSVEPGQYSIVILRTEAGSSVRQFDLLVTPSKEELGVMNRVQAIADLDGDGSMEIVTSSNYYEGLSGQIWRLKAGRLTLLAQNGAGA